MWFSIGLFCFFALASALGAYLITAHFRSRKAGVLAAVSTLLFFVVLACGVFFLMREGGVL
jgi:hypothetical protein